MTQAEYAAEISVAEELPRRERGLWSDAFRRLIRNRLAMLALLVLAVIVVVTLAGNYVGAVQRYDPRTQDYSVLHEGPSADHFFGTAGLGGENCAGVPQ